MKPHNSFTISSVPRLFISHEDLEKIKYIVDLAPKEAQWFHQVEKVKSKDTVYYRVYGMHIPEQYCSSVEVETDPMMMVSFYRDLKKKYGDSTNQIMSNMTVWSHSHHNMGVSPSGQDLRQFNENIENAIKSGQKSPQMMFIFNKKDRYHLRVWDPETKIIYHNLELELLPYDFSEIDKEAKVKFKKKPAPKKKKTKKFIHNNSKTTSWDFLDLGMEDLENDYSSNSQHYSLMEEYLNIGLSTYPSISLIMKKYKQKSKRNFLEALVKDLTIKEFQIFHLMLDLDTDLLLSFEPDEDYSIEENFEDILQDLEALQMEENTIASILVFINFLTNESINPSSVVEEFQSILDDDLDLYVSTY